MFFLVLTLLMACEDGEVTEIPGGMQVIEDPDQPEDNVPVGSDSGDTGDTGEAVDPNPDDDIDDYDGDGYPYDDDCDDDDDDVNPGELDDTCDGIDDDCNGLADDAVDPDIYEQNGAQGTDLGDLTDSQVVVDAYLNPTDDIDDYYFWVADGYFDSFGFDIDLMVPGGIDMVAQLWFYKDSTWTRLLTINDGGRGLDETYFYGGSAFSEDQGWYLLRLYSVDGARCDRTYTLTLQD